MTPEALELTICMVLVAAVVGILIAALAECMKGG